MKTPCIAVLLLAAVCLPACGHTTDANKKSVVAGEATTTRPANAGGNKTKLSDKTILDFLKPVVAAIKARDKKALLVLFHSSCKSLTAAQKKDYALFVKYLLGHSMVENWKWKAMSFKGYNGHLFKINRFPIKPEFGIDLFKKLPKKVNKRSYWALSLCASREKGKLKLIYYMNDYMAKEVKKQK